MNFAANSAAILTNWFPVEHKVWLARVTLRVRLNLDILRYIQTTRACLLHRVILV